MTSQRSNDRYRIGRLVLLDGVPHNVTAVVRDRRSRVIRVHVKSWSGHVPPPITGTKYRKLVSL